MECVLKCENCACRRENQRLKLEKIECAIIHSETRAAFKDFLAARNQLLLCLVEYYFKIHECLQNRTNPFVLLLELEQVNDEEYLFNEAQGTKLQLASDRKNSNDDKAREFLKSEVQQWIIDDLQNSQIFSQFKLHILRKPGKC